jgi:hypothetical protein
MAQLPGDFIQQPTEAQGFLVAAEAMLAGARVLSKATPAPAIALTMLCGHGTEAALKALRAESSTPGNELSRSPYGHDLVTLWDAATSIGTRAASPRPPWVDQLQRVHGRPFNLRYPLGFHAIVLPNLQVMVAGLEELVLLVKR